MLAEIYYRIAQWQKRFRNFDISERYYLASLQHDNPAERTYYDLAYLYLGKSGGALTQRTIDLLEQTIKYVPYFGKGVRELGNMYVQLGQIDKGIEYLLRSTDSNPANIPEAYALVANAYFMKGDYQKAIEYGQKALEEIENSPSWKYYKIPLPDRVFDVNSVRFMAYFAIGASYAQLKDYDSAQKYLELAQSIKPQDMRVLINLSTVYINKGEFDKAEGILNSFEPQDFKEKGAKLFNLASLYAARGDKEKALEYLKAASEVDPTLFDRAFRDKYLKNILRNEN
jgi:tetratricopeptide (TPR) repeat protein